MRSLIPSLVLFLGVCLACVGLWWVWTGLDIVQVERGWTAVIAGATMLSAGFVIAALAAVLVRLGDIAAALELQPMAVSEIAAAEEKADPTVDGTAPVEAKPDSPDIADADHQVVDRHVVGRHVSGDATYVMFVDGSVEAQTREGTMIFPSLDALRSYADEREAGTVRTGAERS